jgi:hypothetical protein
MGELYQKTMDREGMIKDWYNLTTIWECEFDQITEMATFKLEDPSQNNGLGLRSKMNPRDAFYGGRTEPIKLYHNFKNLGGKGRYVDVVSLYPTVQYYDEFPISHPVKIIPKYDEKAKFDYDWFGIIKCQILPPRGLYHPVLPFKQKTKGAHKLLFGLCRTCMGKIDEDCHHINFRDLKTREDKTYARKHCLKCQAYRNEKCQHTKQERAITGTWATNEIQKALEKGYQILEIYEVEHFEKRSKELFKEYINKFYKIKAEASGCPCKSKEPCPPDCPEKLKYIQ